MAMGSTDVLSHTVAVYVCVSACRAHPAAHEDGDAHDDDGDGDAGDERDDHWCTQQHAHLPQNFPGLRPRLLPPERAARGTVRAKWRTGQKKEREKCKHYDILLPTKWQLQCL